MAEEDGVEPEAEPTKPKVKKKRGFREDKKKITEEEWQQIAEFYAQHGEDHSKAAARFGYVRRTMVRLYYEGSANLRKPPIKLMMTDVALRARAIRNKIRDEEIQKADAELRAIIESSDDPDAANSLVDAGMARAHEGMLVSAGRSNMVTFQAVIGRVLKGLMARLPEIEKEVSTTMSARAAVSLIRELGRTLNDTSNAAKTLLEMERLLMGEPTALIGVSAVNMNREQAIRVLSLTAKTYNRLQSRTATIEGVVEPQLQPPSADDPEPLELPKDSDDGEPPSRKRI